VGSVEGTETYKIGVPRIWVGFGTVEAKGSVVDRARPKFLDEMEYGLA
jgi:hypothetical protein